ncbi:MAG: response regulator [Desulfococcaceae bacterium]
METKPIRVLFMDDEPASEIVQVAVEWMETAGFEVDLVESMSLAVEAYYERFYDVFVLDIDMSRVADAEEGDGVNVLKRFISLHNETRVIMFSGAGTTPHWFAAANAHCHAYVHKNEPESVKRLVSLIQSGAEPAAPARPERKGFSQRVLTCAGGSIGAEKLEAAVSEALGLGWEVENVSSLEAANRRLAETPEFAVVLVFLDEFPIFPEEKALLAAILAHSPAPQVIVGGPGEDAARDAILFVANHHPFRMINTAEENWPAALAEALKKAIAWHGRREIFPADADALRRLNIQLPPEALEEWEDYSEEMEELREAFDEPDGDEDGEVAE